MRSRAFLFTEGVRERIAFALVLLALGAPAVVAEEPAAESLESWLARISSEDDSVRMSARLSAPSQGAAAVPRLGEIYEKGEPEARITAYHALRRITHHSGRPEATAEERAATLRALEALTAPGRGAPLRREALWFCGFLAGDKPSVDVAYARLWDDDPHVAEIARLVLERTPSPEAIAALRQAIILASDARRPDLLFSLAKKRAPETVAVFVELSSAKDGKVRLSALEGLARLGAPEGIPILRSAASNAEDPRIAKIFDELLRLADERHAVEDVENASALYSFAMSAAPLDHQRERALHRLSPEGDDSQVPALLRGLDDSAPRVRRLALRRLADLQGARVSSALLEGFEGAKPESKPILLRALVERDRESAKAHLERAARSDEIELRITALDLLDDLARPELADAYLEVAKSGSDSVRAAALRGYFAVAEKRVEDGDRSEATREMFERAVSVAERAGDRSRALQGLIRLRDPAALDLLGTYLSHPDHAVEAANGSIDLIAMLIERGELDDAEKRLVAVATGRFPRDTIARAANELRRIGRDPEKRVREAGFLLDWWLTGPVQNSDGKGLEKEYEPERQIDLESRWQIGPRRYVWQELRDLSFDGRVNLIPVFRRSQNVLAYAFTEIQVAAETKALLKIGSDDGAACWLNGERVHYKPGPSSLAIDAHSVPVTLRAGKNRILLKVEQGGGDWEFAVRLTDPDGKPLVLGND